MSDLTDTPVKVVNHDHNPDGDGEVVYSTYLDSNSKLYIPPKRRRETNILGKYKLSGELKGIENERKIYG